MSEISLLTDKFRSGKLSRREFIDRLVAVTGSAVLARSLAAAAETEASWAEYASGEVKVKAYLARPRTTGPHPALILIHENRGMNEHIQDVSRRFAAEGMLVLAPDLLSRRGGTDRYATREEKVEAVRTLQPEEVSADLAAAVAHLKSRGEVSGDKIAAIGFCWGGAQTFRFATESKALAAAVVFYGSAPEPLEERIAALSCPVLGIYGERDERITSKVPEVDSAMKKHGKSYSAHIYPGAQHAFFNDTNPDRYHPEAAKDAFLKAVAFLRDRLGIRGT